MYFGVVALDEDLIVSNYKKDISKYVCYVD